jgi:hypothetical protein
MNPHGNLPMIDASSFNLDAYQWQNRLLLIFAVSEQTPAYQTQIQQLEEQAKAVRDRDLMLVPVLTTHRVSAGSSSADGASANRMREIALDKLRQRFSIGSEEFTIILIGKDGTEKRREHTPIDPSELFSQIDAMPMRQQEMSQQGQ